MGPSLLFNWLLVGKQAMGKDSQHLGKAFKPKPVYSFTPVPRFYWWVFNHWESLAEFPACDSLKLKALRLEAKLIPHPSCSPLLCTLLVHHWPARVFFTIVREQYSVWSICCSLARRKKRMTFIHATHVLASWGTMQLPGLKERAKSCSRITCWINQHKNFGVV